MNVFNHRDDPSLDYAEEFVVAWANYVKIDPLEYARGIVPLDRNTIKAGSREMFNNFGYIPGFMTWGVPEYCRRLPEERYIASPRSLRFLLEKYKYSHKQKDYFAGLEE